MTAVLFVEDTGCMKRGGKTLNLHMDMWKMWKNRLHAYDNAVLPVLREEPAWHSLYGCWLQAELPGDRIPAGGNILHANQSSPKAQPAYCVIGNQPFTGIKEGGAWC